MRTEIPPDATIESFNLTKDLDFAACCLADDAVPRLPPESVSAFVENAQRIYVFKFAQSPRYSEMAKIWRLCQKQGALSAGEDMVGYIFSAFRYCDRLTALIRSGAGSERPADDAGNFWVTNTKAVSAALAVGRAVNVADERLARMIRRDGEQCGYFMRDEVYAKAFLDPETYCAANPESPLSAIVAGFFHRERLRDVVNSKPARHVFREIDDNGKEKISFIAEPQTV